MIKYFFHKNTRKTELLRCDEIVQNLGEGSFGKVDEAFDFLYDRFIAIKRFTKEGDKENILSE